MAAGPEKDWERIIDGLLRCKLLRSRDDERKAYAIRVACSGVLRRAVGNLRELSERELSECASVIGGWM